MKYSITIKYSFIFYLFILSLYTAYPLRSQKSDGYKPMEKLPSFLFIPLDFDFMNQLSANNLLSQSILTFTLTVFFLSIM